MTCDLVSVVLIRPLRLASSPRQGHQLIAIKDRPCARCIKRSIGHLCHDEPREKGTKNEPSDRAGKSVKEEENLPYMLAPAIEQPQVDQQLLQENGTRLAQEAAASAAPMDPSQFLPQASASVAQGQAFGDKTQQCEMNASLSKVKPSC